MCLRADYPAPDKLSKINRSRFRCLQGLPVIFGFYQPQPQIVVRVEHPLRLATLLDLLHGHARTDLRCLLVVLVPFRFGAGRSLI